MGGCEIKQKKIYLLCSMEYSLTISAKNAFVTSNLFVLFFSYLFLSIYHLNIYDDFLHVICDHHRSRRNMHMSYPPIRILIDIYKVYITFLSQRHEKPDCSLCFFFLHFIFINFILYFILFQLN